MDNQEQRLQQEILADAQKKADRIKAKAQTERDRLLKEYEQSTATLEKERLTETEADIAQFRQSNLNMLGMEKRKLWLRMREESIQALFAQVLAKGENASEDVRQESLIALAEEALSALQAGDYCVEFSTADSLLITESWLNQRALHALGEEVAAACHFTLAPTDSVKGGIRLIAQDQSRLFDNTLATRLQLLQTQLRGMLAD